MTIWTLVNAVITIVGMGLAGAASLTIAGIGQLFLLMSLPEVAVGIYFLGTHLDSIAENGIVGKGKKEWQKELLRKGYI